MTSFKNLFPLFLVLVLSVFLSSCDDDPYRVDYSGAPAPFDLENAERIEQDNGLVIYILEEGAGAFEVQRRDRVSVYYTGRRESNGKIFDSSYRDGNTSPTTFPLSNLIEGFREGLLGMKEGGKRVLIIPPSLGYENAQPRAPGYNLRNDTLRFDIELAEIASN